MEEAPKTNLEQGDNIHQRSDEVQTIIERMPTSWCRWLALCVLLLIGVVVLLSCWIQYPDTIDGQIVISAKSPPVRLVSKTNGRIILLKSNNEIVDKGIDVAYIETGAEYRDLLILDSILNEKTIQNIESVSIPDTLLLGNIARDYNAFLLALYQHQRLLSSDIYPTMIRNLEEKIKIDEGIAKNYDKELSLKLIKHSEVTQSWVKDSTLHSIRGISDQEFRQSQLAKLSSEEEIVRLQSNRMLKFSEINQSRMEVQRIKLEEAEMKAKTRSEYLSRLNNLKNSIEIWKEQNLFQSPIAGQIEFLSFLRENQFVQAGQELFVVIPEQEDITGEVVIPSYGVGKVQIGQVANVKIHNYPYDEFGLIKGEVRSVSRINSTMKHKEQSVDTYLVNVAFPNGMNTNYGKLLPLDFETKGNVEIITKSKRLIERLFDNLKSKGEK